jgi:Leucine-rich repeat (LRR) protein
MQLILLCFLLLLLCIQLPQVQGDACDECSCYKRKKKQYVDCSGVGIDTIPANIPTDVYKLLLQGNDIPDLGTTTTLGANQLPNLQVIFVHNNPIASVTANFFVNAPNVHTLMFHHTEIATLPAGVFNGMTKMKWIWLNNNKLTAVPVDAFKSLTQIIEIYLYNNQITTILNGVFRDQAAIKHLYLFGNEIPKSELNCCQLCGVPEPVDVKWGLIPIDTQLSCAASSSCNINGVSTTCFNNPSKTHNYMFSSANRGMVLTGTLVLVCIILNSIVLWF